MTVAMAVFGVGILAGLLWEGLAALTTHLRGRERSRER